MIASDLNEIQLGGATMRRAENTTIFTRMSRRALLLGVACVSLLVTAGVVTTALVAMVTGGFRLARELAGGLPYKDPQSLVLLCSLPSRPKPK